MALDRLLRLRKQLSDSAKAESSRRHADVLHVEEKLRACRGAADDAIAAGGLAALELLAEASVHALEARRAAKARAELALAAALEAHREMRQVEIVVEHHGEQRTRRRAGVEQAQADEHAARSRRAAR
jgi:flagellar biosynthesis chaperone FliJ